MKRSALIATALLWLSLCASGAADSTPANKSPLGAPKAEQDLAVLPNAFAGWQLASQPRKGSDPAAVDSAQSAALKEYGFAGYELATYAQAGRKLTVRAARFQDATGAYGAFTFYRLPAMLPERIGGGAAADGDRVLFFQNNFLIEARFDRITGMSAAELRELAQMLPRAEGPAANLPTLPNYLPREGVVANSTRFVLGPAAYATLGLDLPESVIDFSRNPEIAAGRVKQDSDEAVLLLISYPTPQIAIEKLSAFERLTLSPNLTYVVKRTGPIIKLVYGTVSTREANNLLGRVNYQAEVTWNENTGLSKRDNIGSLVIAALSLAGIIVMFSLGTGVVFGFGRAVVSRIWPSRFGKNADAEIIRLNLRK